MNQRKTYTSHRFSVMLLLFSAISFPGFGQVGSAMTTPPPGCATAGSYQYFDLNCNVGAWEGYFAPERWERSLSTSAPSGDNVVAQHETAPAESATVIVGTDRGAVERWTIEIPAAGYLSFRIRPAGRVPLAELRVKVNDRAAAFNPRPDGFYYSPFLRAGDRFTLEIPAGKAIYHWTELLFHSNYSAVVVRPRQSEPTLRYAPVEAELIHRVLFPSDAPGTWPVFDRDGDPTTVYDQTELRTTNEYFRVVYHDEVVAEGDRFHLERVFNIQERCSRGSRLRTRRRWADLPLIEN